VTGYAEKSEGGEQRVWCGEAEASLHFIGPGRWPAVVEFYSSSVLKELKGEEDTGKRRLDGGNEEGGALVRFGYSLMEVSGRRRLGQRGGDADGSQR
jgi:hypothetical protein